MRDLHNTPTRYIMKLSAIIHDTLDSLVEGTAVTPMEARALLFIATAKTPLCQKDIELEYGLSRATVSELMRNMEQKGMIQRQRAPSDRRKNQIVVRDEYRPFVDNMIARMDSLEDRLAEGIPAGDIGVFIDTISHMTRNVSTDVK